MLLATSSVPATDLTGFVAHAKHIADRYSCSSYGPGSPPYLAWAMLAHKERLDLLNVPYKGIAPVIQAMLGNEVQLSLASGAIAVKLMEAGKLKALAVAGTNRDQRDCMPLGAGLMISRRG